MEEILNKMKEIEELKYAEEEINKVKNLIYNKNKEIKQKKDQRLLTLVKSPKRTEIENEIEIKEQEKTKLQEQLDLLVQNNRTECKEKFKIKKEELINIINNKKNSLKDNTEELDYLLLRIRSIPYEKLQLISEDNFKQKYENKGNQKLADLKIGNEGNIIEKNALNKLKDKDNGQIEIMKEYNREK